MRRAPKNTSDNRSRFAQDKRRFSFGHFQSVYGNEWGVRFMITFLPELCTQMNVFSNGALKVKHNIPLKRRFSSCHSEWYCPVWSVSYTARCTHRWICVLQHLFSDSQKNKSNVYFPVFPSQPSLHSPLLHSYTLRHASSAIPACNYTTDLSTIAYQRAVNHISRGESSLIKTPNRLYTFTPNQTYIGAVLLCLNSHGFVVTTKAIDQWHVHRS